MCRKGRIEVIQSKERKKKVKHWLWPNICIMHLTFQFCIFFFLRRFEKNHNKKERERGGGKRGRGGRQRKFSIMLSYIECVCVCVLHLWILIFEKKKKFVPFKVLRHVIFRREFEFEKKKLANGEKRGWFHWKSNNNNNNGFHCRQIFS